MNVNLTPSEMMQAALVGVMRHVQNVKEGRKHAYNYKDDTDWQIHIEGAMAEAALAKVLGVYWCGTGVRGATDVGDVDVRATANDNYSLIVHDHDRDERVIFLLTGKNGVYTIRGWMRASDAKKPQYWKDPTGKNRPAYFVPQHALKTIQEYWNAMDTETLRASV